MPLKPEQLQVLEDIGVQYWALRHTQCPTAKEVDNIVEDALINARTVELPQALSSNSPVSENPGRDDVTLSDRAKVRETPASVSNYDWQQLKAAVSQCHVCELSRTRNNTVFGVGDEQADWMVIGEAPGADEDRQGEPFVGRAGQLLNNMLLAIGLKREQVYIANILKCRPPSNRDPRAEEVLCCEAYLLRQIELIQPKLLLAVGRVAAHNLLKSDFSLAKLRGKLHHYGANSVPLVVTYHPAYLLRSPGEKRKAWQDLLYARSVVREANSA